MRLKGRLKLIADMTPCCNTVCDVGTDHAFVPIHLVKKGVCKRAIATDVKKGPLLAAKENIEDCNLKECIEARLGDGLDCIGVREVDAIIIAGMGGTLIAEILDRGVEAAKAALALILQPMTAIEEVREWLYSNGFDIYDESLINETEKIYNVIAAKWSGNIYKPEDIYYHIGERLVEKRDPLLGKYIAKKIRQLEKVVWEMQGAGIDDDETVRKYEAMKARLEGILSELGISELGFSGLEDYQDLKEE